jgi:hypothetical protein
MATEYYFRAINVHQAEHDGELDLAVGDLVTAVKDLGNGWLLGRKVTAVGDVLDNVIVEEFETAPVGIYPEACVRPLLRNFGPFGQTVTCIDVDANNENIYQAAASSGGIHRRHSGGSCKGSDDAARRNLTSLQAIAGAAAANETTAMTIERGSHRKLNQEQRYRLDIDDVEDEQEDEDDAAQVV